MIRRILAHALQAAHDYLDGRHRRERLARGDYYAHELRHLFANDPPAYRAWLERSRPS